MRYIIRFLLQYGKFTSILRFKFDGKVILMNIYALARAAGHRTPLRCDRINGTHQLSWQQMRHETSLSISVFNQTAFTTKSPGAPLPMV